MLITTGNFGLVTENAIFDVSSIRRMITTPSVAASRSGYCWNGRNWPRLRSTPNGSRALVTRAVALPDTWVTAACHRACHLGLICDTRRRGQAEGVTADDR
jgi:hypothetical protein